MNEQITASRVQVITESGEQLGILPFSEALGMAWEQDLDLVEMAVRDGVVIAKIIDWQKQLFIEKKNKKKNQATAKKTELKTLRLSYAIGEHDMEIRRNQAEKFAKEDEKCAFKTWLVPSSSHSSIVSPRSIASMVPSNSWVVDSIFSFIP